jgi:O-antigen/teichoic acid export membrane protein
MQWMFASVPMLALATLYAELLRAADRHVTAALLQSAVVPLINLAFLVTLAQHIGSASAMSVVYFLATIVMMGLGRWLWARVARQTAGSPCRLLTPETVSTTLVFGTGLRMFPAALAGILMTWADILLLGVWAPSEEVGVYNAAVRTALLTSFMLLAINSVVAPRFAAASLRDDLPATAALARRACLLSLLATAPVLAVFVGLSEQVLQVFGPQFVAGSTALVIVSLGQMVNAMTGPVGHMLNMRGFHADESRLAILAAALNVGLCCWLIPRHGVTGAAWANALAVAACNIARVVTVRARMGIWVYPGL